MEVVFFQNKRNIKFAQINEIKNQVEPRAFLKNVTIAYSSGTNIKHFPQKKNGAPCPDIFVLKRENTTHVLSICPDKSNLESMVGYWRKIVVIKVARDKNDV